MSIFVSIKEFDTAQLQRLQALADQPVVHRQHYADDAPVEPAFLECEIVFGNVPPEWLPQHDNLRWAQLESVGFGEYRLLDWQNLGQQLKLTNLAGFFADPVAESVLAGILSFYRGIDQLAVLRAEQTWVGDPLRSKLQCLSESSVVLFGIGSINRRVAELLVPFNCKTTSFSSNWEVSALDTAIHNSDIVISNVPETDKTIGVFTAERLALLGPDGLFVNTGRGSVVDEAALATALTSGNIGGAVIDVTIDEPLPKEHPLWTTPNTILTQHTGGGTADELDRKIDVFADNLKRYNAGEPLDNIVDFERGY